MVQTWGPRKCFHCVPSCFAASLEPDLDRALSNARIARTANYAKAVRAAWRPGIDISVGIFKLGVVEQVEELHSEVETNPLGYLRGFDQSHIGLV